MTQSISFSVNLGLTDRNQPTRSWIRNELIDFNGNSLEEDADSNSQEYVKEHWEQKDVHNYIKAQWQEIHDAIGRDDVDLLDCLTPPINIFNNKEKYWSNELDSYSYRQGTNILSFSLRLERTRCIQVLLNKLSSGDLDPYALNDYLPYRSKPICYACNNRDLNLVRELVECAHADIN
ncbi:unnamed protein product [Rotaria magnacalcarata]|uniref:Uncharacterized protein n=2 Tax=Rotaria magnacalcarata TaxID=392030 RepID=A0A815NYJ8_9BILA|nr:unnamed protein product [Rotaria magnacalcarata]CAF1437141.1 unnamed protein product [Rotaria magnacalcarata]CAF4829800.1 unnamed protein product [Rotaria magnacalcarata]